MIYKDYLDNRTKSELVEIIKRIMSESHFSERCFLEEVMFETQDFKNVRLKGLKLYENNHDGMTDIFEDVFDQSIHEFGLAMHKATEYSLDDDYIRYHENKLESFSENEYRSMLVDECDNILYIAISEKGFDYVINKLMEYKLY